MELERFYNMGLPLEAPLNEKKESAVVLFALARHSEGVEQMIKWGADINSQARPDNDSVLHKLVY